MKKASEPWSTDKCNHLVFSVNKGFSLLEVVIALGILGFVLLPFLGFISYRVSQEKQSDEMIKAAEIAKLSMERALISPIVVDAEELVDQTFLVQTKVLDGDKFDEPKDLLPLEVRVVVFRLKDRVKLVELHALK